jgi:signal transduction histidine kinase
MRDIRTVLTACLRDALSLVMEGLLLLRTGLPVLAGFALIYIVLAGISIFTATVQPNAAAVWMPSGFAIGLLIVRGLAFWPAIAMGAFAFNLTVNILAEPNAPVAQSILIALFVAIGNTAEAVFGAALARRFAEGAAYLARVRPVALFMLLVATLPPIFSTTVGIVASRWGELPTHGSLLEVACTWYIANSVGILVFCGLTVAWLNGQFRMPGPMKTAEAVLLALAIGFVGQAICGAYMTDWLEGWPRSYMVIPLLLWACFRFGSTGGLMAIAFVTMIAAIGTMSGFTVFPSSSVSRSLIYLQIFLGMLAVITLTISAALAEVTALQISLEDRVRIRTREVERLVHAREVFTTLVAHDLQGPVYGIRNALRAASSGMQKGLIGPQDLASAFAVVDDTCTALAERITSLLDQSRNEGVTTYGQGKESLIAILRRIATAHQAALNVQRDDPDAGLSARLVYEGDRQIAVDHPAAVEHILDTLIDNALKYSPIGKPVKISAFRHSGTIEIAVADEGPGIPEKAARNLFRPGRKSRTDPESPGAGLGLYLASEQANEIGGRLSYSQADKKGSVFRLVIRD